MNLVETVVGRLAADSATRVAHSARITGLPLPRLPGQVGRSSTRYAFTTIDERGRLGNRSLVRALDWQPGTPLKPTVLDDQLILLARSAGTAKVTKLGHVRLPAAIRLRCQLSAGDGLLLVTSADHDLLVVCTAWALDQMLGARMQGQR